jgi:hypothetical protein
MTRINVEHVYPPIPLRGFDWRASLDGYEPGDLLGYGPTRDAAVLDLIEQAWEAGLIDEEEAHRRACEQAPAKTAELEPTRPAMPSEPCDVWMQTNAGVRESDEAGIDAFVPPPEREKPAVATPRLMHGQRWHGWIWGAM